MKISITKEFEFEAAHRLPWHKGGCYNLHGHTYKLQVTIKGELNENGIIMDFGDLKKLVKKHIIDIYDHSYLNDFFENPTAELMAEKILEILNSYEKRIVGIRLWETTTSYAEVML